jgi:hypothetical protein
MKSIAFVVLLAGSVGVAAGAQEHEGCPMHSSSANHDQVDKRHEEATAVEGDGTGHHFLLAKDGGSIRLEVQDTTRVETRDRIRAHLQVIAQSFAAGDFSMPTRIHDRVPPGVEVMQRHKAEIRYDYSPTPGGGVVRISTGDAEALVAVHDFLRFQIRDHATGDPTE